MIDQLASELALIRQQRRMARRKRYYRSRLDQYRAEIVGLRRAGATLAEIAVWLRRRRIKVVQSTISRYLSKLPEVSDHA